MLRLVFAVFVGTLAAKGLARFVDLLCCSARPGRNMAVRWADLRRVAAVGRSVIMTC